MEIAYSSGKILLNEEGKEQGEHRRVCIIYPKGYSLIVLMKNYLDEFIGGLDIFFMVSYLRL